MYIFNVLGGNHYFKDTNHSVLVNLTESNYGNNNSATKHHASLDF